jgi:hypothetical protein
VIFGCVSTSRANKKYWQEREAEHKEKSKEYFDNYKHEKKYKKGDIQCCQNCYYLANGSTWQEYSKEYDCRKAAPTIINDRGERCFPVIFNYELDTMGCGDWKPNKNGVLFDDKKRYPVHLSEIKKETENE